MAEKHNTTLEEIKVRGNQLADRVRDIIEEGNARRIIVKKEGRSVMEFPLSVGVGGAAAAIMIAPMLAAIGAFASLASDVRIVIERVKEPDSAGAITRSGTPGTPGAAAGEDAPTAPTPSVGKAPSPASASNKGTTP